MTYPLATLASSENHRGCVVDIAVHRSEVQKVYEQQPLDISQPISCSSNTVSLCLSLPFFLHVSFRICYRSINSFFSRFSRFARAFFFVSSSPNHPGTHGSRFQQPTRLSLRKENERSSISLYIYALCPRLENGIERDD